MFFPLRGGTAIAPPGPETTQRTFSALADWAASLSLAYLDGALARALALETQTSPLISRLTDAEYEALDVADRLETAAAVERTAAELDDAAATAARDEAERIRRERLATEGALAASEEAAATVEADLHEQAARDARAIAADAERRRRSAQVEATRSDAGATSRHHKEVAWTLPAVTSRPRSVSLLIALHLRCALELARRSATKRSGRWIPGHLSPAIGRTGPCKRCASDPRAW